MLRLRFGRSLAIAAIAGSAALAAAPMVAPAGAVTRTGIKCSKLAGNISTTIKASTCTGNTGGASKAMSSSALATGSGKVNWVNGKSTGFKVTITQSGTLCKPLGAAWTQYNAKGNVTSDTTGSTHVGAAVTAHVCVNGNTGAIRLAPNTKLVIAP
jgi:hypothetical protein